jgi:flagellar biosynthetic protein FliO
VNAYLRNIVIFVFLAVPVGVQAAGPSSPAPETKAAAEATVPTPDSAPASQLPDAREGDMQFPVMRTVGSMGLVVFLMLGAFLAVKKFAPRYFNKPVSQRNMKVVETLGMGDRRSISLIEVGNSRYLVGNTPHQISLLASLPNSVSLLSEPDEMPAASKASTKKGAAAPFRNLFDVEKSRPSIQHTAHPLPDDLRVKMRQLREALERS